MIDSSVKSFREMNAILGLQEALSSRLRRDPSVDDLDVAKVNFLLVALNGELGELSNEVKKWVRSGESEFGQHTRRAVRGEIADILSYLVLTTDELGIELDVALAAKSLVNYLHFVEEPSPDEQVRTVVVMGGAGVGKTSVARSFPAPWAQYVEEHRANEEVMRMMRGESFDAYRLQRLFIDGLSDWLARVEPDVPIVLDQHPAIQGTVYSEIWFRNGRIDSSQYVDLLARAAAAAAAIHGRDGELLIVHLDASPEAMRERHAARDGHAPGLSWFVQVAELSEELAEASGHIELIDTEVGDLVDVIERVHAVVPGIKSD